LLGVRYTLESSIGKCTLKSLKFCDSPIFYSSYRSLNLTICLIYVENVDLVDTSSRKLGIPYEVEFVNVCINH
jgi:hypothetical protein